MLPGIFKPKKKERKKEKKFCFLFFFIENSSLETNNIIIRKETSTAREVELRGKNFSSRETSVARVRVLFFEN